VADDAGALLVRSGLVSSSALDDARSKVTTNGGTLGEQLVAAGALGDDVLTDFYKSRLLVPQVNPNTLARLPAKVVAVIPSEMAIELRAIPVLIDGDNNLTIAMSDPSDRHAVDEISFFTGAHVVRAVATQMQIAWCLAHYYGHVTFLGQRLLQPNSTAPSRALQAAVKPRQRGVTGKINAARHKPDTAVDAAPTPTEIIDEPTAPTPAPPTNETPPPNDDAPITNDIQPTDAIPEVIQTRARSVSGEIRAHPRAPSIKPPLPDFEHESGPVVIIEESSAPLVASAEPDIEAEEEPTPAIIEIEAEPGDEPTDPTRKPKRKRPAEPDPPELAARAGEVDMKSAPSRAVDEGPRIVIDEELAEPPPATSRTKTDRLPSSVEVSGELKAIKREDRAIAPQITVEVSGELDDSAPVVIHEHMSEPSEPVLLDRRRPSELPTEVGGPLPDLSADDAEEVVALDVKRPERPERVPRRTQMGIGVIAAVTRARSDTDAVPTELEEVTDARRPIDIDPTRVDAHAVPPGEHTTSDEILAAPPSPVRDDDTSPIALPPSGRGATPVPPPSGKIKLDNVRPRTDRDDDDDEPVPTRPTEVMSAVDLDEIMPERKRGRVDDDVVDEGWGPPGDTIPPPLLGAIPGVAADRASGIIPIPNMDSQPLIVAAPKPPEQSRPDISAQGLVRALEETTTRVLELIRGLEHAGDRDAVVTAMVAHLAQTHRRAGFFAVRGGELSMFAMAPPPQKMPTATLRLDRPSTLQDVVGTRLPYRGPMHDDTSRKFLAAVLGVAPQEILLVPVTVRERVVGILFGEHRVRHTFDDQLALAARAAGAALERILKTRRG
jgi:hypothetical protein